jgi:hypothetical protein
MATHSIYFNLFMLPRGHVMSRSLFRSGVLPAAQQMLPSPTHPLSMIDALYLIPTGRPQTPHWLPARLVGSRPRRLLFPASGYRHS